MSNIQRRGGTLPAVPTETAQALDEANTRAIAAFAGASNGGGIMAALDVAKGIEDLRVLFDQPEIRARVVALQDTPLGFRTDRDPKVKNRKTEQFNTPYPYEVVKDAAIEAGLRGLQLVGNQFNIIAGRFYSTKEGLEFLIRKMPAVTDFRPVVGVPAVKPGGVLIDCEATWQQGGKPMAVKVTIPIKSDDFSSADQLIGKATRKLLARCYSIMTGNTVPEGEAGDEVPIHEATVTTVAPKPVFRQATTTTTTATPQPEPTPAVVVDPAPTPPPAPVAQSAPAQANQDEIKHLWDSVLKVTNFDGFRDWAMANRYEKADMWGSFDDVPGRYSVRLAKAKTQFLESLALHVQGGAK